uniref:Helicase C-terminal domain-containing protein n=1 Tax=Ditylenchus dipsaci TaxID=166011 RepID=A0A915CQQ4_9BILA
MYSACFLGVDQEPSSSEDDSDVKTVCFVIQHHQNYSFFFAGGQARAEVGSLHSQIIQSQRTASLTRFRSGKIRILICTDVAARVLISLMEIWLKDETGATSRWEEGEYLPSTLKPKFEVFRACLHDVGSSSVSTEGQSVC